VVVPTLLPCGEGVGEEVVGEQSPTLEPGPGFLYGCDPTEAARALGKSGTYLNLLVALVGEYASQAGYGEPA
jgi:hypothetical protein